MLLLWPSVHSFGTLSLGSFREGAVLNIVTELAESGSLYDLIKKRKASGAALPENQVWKYFLQTALGLQHIHSHRILHRDVKPANVLLARRSQRIKLGDPASKSQAARLGSKPYRYCACWQALEYH